MGSSALRDYYDSAASKYGNSEGKAYPQFLKQKLLREVARPEFVCLDIGVANGLHALQLSLQVSQVYGLDISAEMLQAAKQSSEDFTNLHLVRAGGEHVPLTANHFDLVYSFSTFVFLLNFELALQHVFRVLKPGGMAILDISGTYNLSRIHWTRHYRKLGHPRLNHFPLGKAKQILNTQGFEILEVHSTGFLDQWKYIPLVRYLSVLGFDFHSRNGKPDLDYRASQLLPGLANRWYFVLRKPAKITKGYSAAAVNKIG